jgi:hypothetical protein
MGRLYDLVADTVSRIGSNVVHRGMMTSVLIKQRG